MTSQVPAAGTNAWSSDRFSQTTEPRGVSSCVSEVVPVTRVSIILEEIRHGERGALMRYDDAHGRFHRHAPGWPEPSEQIEVFLDVPVRLRASVADAEIRALYTAWEADVFGVEGELR